MFHRVRRGRTWFCRRTVVSRMVLSYVGLPSGHTAGKNVKLLEMTMQGLVLLREVPRH